MEQTAAATQVATNTAPLSMPALGENARVDEDDVDHRQERGQSGQRLGADIGPVCRQPEILIEKAVRTGGLARRCLCPSLIMSPCCLALATRRAKRSKFNAHLSPCGHHGQLVHWQKNWEDGLAMRSGHMASLTGQYVHLLRRHSRGFLETI